MDSIPKRFAWTVVKIKTRIGRGQGWLYYIKDVAYVTITIRIFEDVFRRFGFGEAEKFKYLYFILPILFFAGCYVVGYLDEKYGIWKMEAVYGSKDLNPFMDKLDKKIDRILEAKKE